jgi:16S rRNA processing protein RimM
VVEFDGITERESVGALSGRELFVPEDRIEPPGAGEYYYYQLIGLDVETRDGVKLGVLRSILETGSADIYVVDREGVEFLVPAIEDVICEVDLERNKMVVDPPEGLLDDL